MEILVKNMHDQSYEKYYKMRGNDVLLQKLILDLNPRASMWKSLVIPIY